MISTPPLLSVLLLILNVWLHNIQRNPWSYYIRPSGVQRQHVFFFIRLLIMQRKALETNSIHLHEPECESCHVRAESPYTGTALCIYWRRTVGLLRAPIIGFHCNFNEMLTRNIDPRLKSETRSSLFVFYCWLISTWIKTFIVLATRVSSTLLKLCWSVVL